MNDFKEKFLEKVIDQYIGTLQEDNTLETVISELFDLENLDSDFTELKDWGWKYNIFSTPFFSVDVCYVERGGYCSLHYHRHKYNRFYVIFGRLRITTEYYNKNIGGTEQEMRSYILGPYEKFRKFEVLPGLKHQFKAEYPTIAIEVESVRCMKDDINRLNQGGVCRKENP
jgi:hypothetical protein